MKLKDKSWAPALATFLALCLIVALVIINAEGDPLALARLGTRFSINDPEGTAGYDGQFVYYIARDLRPDDVSAHLDVPAYRYQRILMPLLARLLSFGNLGALPWVLAAIGIIAQSLGTWGVASLLKRWDVNPWYALVYGVWVGFVLAVRLDLPEPLAYSLIVAALMAILNEKHGPAWMLYGLALFAKEVTIVFVAAQSLVYLWRRQWRSAFGLGLLTLLPYGLFQFWLWRIFGALGLGSGGDMATPFEWIPLMGLIRIGAYSPKLLLASLVVFGPFLLLPAFWGLWVVGKKVSQRQINLIDLAFALNALVILFLPFSTFREPGGLLRFSCGLVLALILFVGRGRYQKILRYMPLMLVLNVFLLK